MSKKNNENYDHHTFISPFTWRYGSEEMRNVFSEITTRSYWRQIWSLLAEAQVEYGLVTEEESKDIKSKVNNIDLIRSHEIEEEIKHDIMAEIKAYAEQTSIGGKKIHLGATSADIEDNVEIIKFLKATDIILTKLVNCLNSMRSNILKYSDLTCMGWTHIQPAEPTTLGYRFASYAQDLLLDIINIETLREKFIKGKGLKGAVGTSASYKNLLKEKGEPRDLENKVMNKLGLDVFQITSQTYPRKVDLLILSALSSIAQSAHKFSLDLRIFQSPLFGELSEPISKSQVGSSTMAFKQNPVKSERICSLARYVSALPVVSFMNASLSIFERTLDDSANRRIILPESFLSIDECLILYQQISKNIVVNINVIKKNLSKFGIFAGTEALMFELVKKGENRQKIHELIREYSFKAWDEIKKGNANPLKDLIKNDKKISKLINKSELDKILNPVNYTGDASIRAQRFVKDSLDPVLLKYSSRLDNKTNTRF